MSDLAGVNVIGEPRRFVLHRVAVPLRHAHRSAHGSEAVREVVIVEWQGEGDCRGWAECPTFSEPGYVTQTTDQAWRELTEVVVPAELGWEGCIRPDRASAAVSAVRDARLDAGLRSSGTPLVRHLGGHIRPLERTKVIAGVGQPLESVLAAVRGALDGGASLVKIKITPKSGEVVRVAAGVFGAGRICVDANESLGSIEQLSELDEIGLAYIEQPFPRSMPLENLALATGEMRTPVALDESIRAEADIERVIVRGAASIINVKAAKVGGLEAASRCVALCEDLGVDAFVGGMVETSLGRAASLAVASLPGCTVATDLGPSSDYFEVDIAEPIGIGADGRISALLAPGSGREPVDALLGRFGVDQMEFSR